MSPTLQELKDAVDLPAGERAKLAEFVLHSLDEPSEPLSLHADRPPLRADEGGVVRVGGSRISLDLVVQQYENGMTPEDMVRAYDALQLADVHAVIAYYLRRRDEVRAKIEAERPPAHL